MFRNASCRSALPATVTAILCTFALCVPGAAHFHTDTQARPLPSQEAVLGEQEHQGSRSSKLLSGLEQLVKESVGDRGKSQIMPGIDAMQQDLAVLIRENEELQSLLLKQTASDRFMAKLSEHESKAGHSQVLPLKTAAKIALSEAEGGRRASSAPIHGHGSDEVAVDAPILVPHRRGRDDVLALKLLSLLEAGACALNDTGHVLNSASALSESFHSSRLPTEAAHPDALAAALWEDDAGMQRRQGGEVAAALFGSREAGGAETLEPSRSVAALRGGGTVEEEEQAPPRARGAEVSPATVSGGSMAARLRGGGDLDLHLEEIAERKQPQVFPFLPDLKIDRRRMVKEILGKDPAEVPEEEEEEEEEEGWYDAKDELETEEEEECDSDGRPVPAEGVEDAPADPVAWAEEEAADREIDRKAARYRARKLPPVEEVPELSDDWRVRLAAQRNFTQGLHNVRAGKVRNERPSKKELQRARQIQLLRRDYFELGYVPREGKDDYMSKEEAAELLDARDQEEMYRFYCDELLPLALQSPYGPEATMQSLPLLKEVYSEERRFGGVDEELLRPDDRYAALNVACDERAAGEADHPSYPRKRLYEKGDWETRIIGTNPLMPAVNSKLMFRALESANATARRLQRQQAKEQEVYRNLLVQSGLEEGRGEEAMEDDESARQRRLLSRWGSTEPAALNEKVMELTAWAARSTEASECKFLQDHRGRILLEPAADPMALANISAVVDDGADVNYKDPEMSGWTPLHLAAAEGSEETVRLLVEKGADMAAVSDNGGTPLHYAAFNDRNATVRALLSLGAEVDARNDFLQTPLHLAASFAGNASAVALLEAGADPSARDAEGSTAADMVADLDFSESKLGPWLSGLQADQSYKWLLALLREKEAERGAMALES